VRVALGESLELRAANRLCNSKSIAVIAAQDQIILAWTFHQDLLGRAEGYGCNDDQ
jgi:hypothetical protein